MKANLHELATSTKYEMNEKWFLNKINTRTNYC